MSVSGGRVALVTGANKGIGLEVVRQLAGLGVECLLGARAEVRGKRAEGELAAAGLRVRAVRLDVTDPVSVAALAKWVEREYGQLDVLVNNAGIVGSFNGPPSEVGGEDMREVFETNVFGVVTVTNAMLPLLRRSPAGRIVNLSSDAGSLTLNADEQSPFRGYNLMTYQSSKTALNALTVAYAKELRGTGIKVNSANPGFTATDINGHRGHRTVEEGARIAVRLATLGPDGPTGTSQDDNGTVPW
ncbi:SDR family oxidoreductase [Streptomyces sp. SCSIO ZS0520]|uniref:SDR family oxidoreductase n=1 Tax=Streptomyces sp. SCSIO ZS0520 TaxID=2892996 RepID=UPI0021DB4F75|nr:SDR family oxidoreductase [Streptomyces sp. SCSIO ZS0520]